MGRTIEIIRKDIPVNAKGAEPQKKRVAAYCRVSTDLEEQQSSLQIQISSFKTQIDTRPDWELVDIYTDEGLSGTQAEHRTEFLRMMADCDLGKIDYIITKSISRFARNTLECLSYVRHLKEQGVNVYFEKERLDTTSATSEMLLSIMAAVAQEESRNISENIKWNQRKRFAAGMAKWSAVYGYKKVGELEYLIDEESAPIIHRIFTEYAHGRTLPEIVTGLHTDKIESPRGSGWSPTVMANMLANEKYCGDLLIQKSYTLDHISHKRVWNDQSTVPSYFIRDHHKPIVDRKTFDMVQIIRSLKDRHKGATQYPYYGRLLCPYCGALMIRNNTKEHSHPAVWHCSPDSESELCRGYFIREEYIDNSIKSAYAKLDIAALQRQAQGKEEIESLTTQNALQLIKDMPRLTKIEYYILDILVEKITFPKWDVMEIRWTFGGKTRVDIHYKKERDIPNHKKQLACVGSMSWSHMAEYTQIRPRYNAYKRPSFYGYDSMVTKAEESD